MENTLFSHREMKLKYCAARNGRDTTAEAVHVAVRSGVV